MSIGCKLKQARLNAKLTQEELSEKIGVSRQTISSWENERSYPDIINIILLSDIYEITVDSLVKGDEGLLKDLEKSTEVVRNNKKWNFISFLWLIFYSIIFSLFSFIKMNLHGIHRIEDLPSNILVLSISGITGIIIGIVYLIKMMDIKYILTQKTSNKTLAKIIISFLFFLGQFSILSLINGLSNASYVQNMIFKIGASVLLFITFFLILKKIIASK